MFPQEHDILKNTILNDNCTINSFPQLGMLFTLSVGLHNVPLSAEEKVKASPSYQV